MIDEISFRLLESFDNIHWKEILIFAAGMITIGLLYQLYIKMKMLKNKSMDDIIQEVIKEDD